MFGPSGQKAYTASVMKILSSAQLVRVTPPKYYDQLDPQNRRQDRYQTKQEKMNSNRWEKPVNSGHISYNQYS